MNKIDLVKIIQNGGATLDDSGRAVSFKRGYQVSKKDCFTLSVRHTNKILRAVNSLLNGLKPGEFCGVWVDGGRVYVDISERITSKREALKLGRERAQISIFDWRTGAAIFC